MSNFTITNLNVSSATYNGQTIASGASYTVTFDQTAFATDGPLLVDLALGYAAVTINSKTLSGPAAATLLIQMTLISFSGIINESIPERAMLAGSKDPNGNIIPIKIDSNGNLYTNCQPKYNSSLPTPSSGDRIDCQVNQFGEAAVQFRNQYSNIVGNSTTTVKSGSGRLHGIMINKNWTGGTATIYDNTAGSGTKIATIDFGSPSGGLLSTTGLPTPTMIGPLGLEFSTGLTVVTSGSSSNNITILYQ